MDKDMELYKLLEALERRDLLELYVGYASRYNLIDDLIEQFVDDEEGLQILINDLKREAKAKTKEK
jgi:hypothetical protein